MNDTKDKIMFTNIWIIFKDNKKIGMIQKTNSIGISERIYRYENERFVEFWNNWKTNNPKQSRINDTKQSLQELYSNSLKMLYPNR